MNKSMIRAMNKLSTVLSCRHFPRCSGCEIQGELSAPPVWEKLLSFFQQAAPQLSIPVIWGEVTGWRTRSKLAVRGTSQAPAIGLFRRGSHEVVSIPDCPLHHPSINKAVALIADCISSFQFEPYNEALGTGFLRYLQFSVERVTSQVELTCVLNRPFPSLKDVVNQLYSKGLFHSIWVNMQPEKTNRIFGEKWIHCAGEPILWESLGTVRCAFHPGCFSQANLPLFEKALYRISDWVNSKSSVLELYCGTGAIGFNLARRGCKVHAVEMNPHAAESFDLTRKQLPLEVQNRISFEVAQSEGTSLDGYEVLIVDPPRKGLGLNLVKEICKTKDLKQIIYLSCGPQSLQRDLGWFIERGWSVEKAEGYLFFPGTDHIEMLCSLKKESG